VTGALATEAKEGAPYGFAGRGRTAPVLRKETDGGTDCPIRAMETRHQ
jgi:hypothetical protein